MSKADLKQNEDQYNPLSDYVNYNKDTSVRGYIENMNNWLRIQTRYLQAIKEEGEDWHYSQEEQEKIFKLISKDLELITDQMRATNEAAQNEEHEEHEYYWTREHMLMEFLKYISFDLTDGIIEIKMREKIPVYHNEAIGGLMEKLIKSGISEITDPEGLASALTMDMIYEKLSIEQAINKAIEKRKNISVTTKEK